MRLMDQGKLHLSDDKYLSVPSRVKQLPPIDDALTERPPKLFALDRRDALPVQLRQAEELPDRTQAPGVVLVEDQQQGQAKAAQERSARDAAVIV